MIRAFLPVACAALFLPLGATAAGQADGLAYLDHSLRLLHSEEVVNLRQRYGGKPLLLVNTASHCGYTGQFKALEALHKTYKDRGLKVVGFASNDFRQEAANEAEAAQVCFVNYGVSFDMFAPIGVSGDGAHPVFRELARQSGAPRWNFHKYVVDRNGKVIAAFPSRVEPDSREVREAIERAL
ncbi:glutathione peroxidase [Aromatoleum petrolei]|uniref:Glutathione peroxidase n=1 Tax=Aromatoleum petrolei TaxID=76116 RepID=A0ABX1MYL9_9RHOO|nr:glutathione peroxidase [Aromatoleum petrolei]NMF91154.1 glutathione peroxidase [Aromatoleum petrolei]QTQ37612.1 Glutathione peroxidase [Aromatoleum petrolei]